MANIQFLRDNFTYQDGGLVLNTLAVLVSISIPTLLAIITYQLNKKSKAEEQLLQKKREVFEGFIATLFNYLNKKGKNEYKLDKELEKGMLEFKKNLILYASQQTINAHNIWINNYNFREKMNKPDDKAMFADIDYLLFCLRKEIGLEDNDYTNTFWSKILRFIWFVLSGNFLFGQRKHSRLQTIIKDDLQIFFGTSVKLLPFKIWNFVNKIVVLYLFGGLTSLIIKMMNMIKIMLNKEPIKYQDIQKSFEKLEQVTNEQFKK